jgi:hypothetical protein
MAGLMTRLGRLERARGYGRVRYPAPVFSDACMLQATAVLLAALGEDALLAELIPRVGEDMARRLVALAAARGEREDDAVAE